LAATAVPELVETLLIPMAAMVAMVAR
jgi:hypothetical protein